MPKLCFGGKFTMLNVAKGPTISLKFMIPDFYFDILLYSLIPCFASSLMVINAKTGSPAMCDVEGINKTIFVGRCFVRTLEQ